VTKGPSSATTSSPETTMPMPEYLSLHYVDVDIKDRPDKDWEGVRALLDSGS
jgi:hypothetical protein